MSTCLLFYVPFLSVACALGTMEGRVARGFDSCVNDDCESTGTDIRFCSIQGRCESCSPSTCNLDVCRQWRGCQGGTVGPNAQNPDNDYVCWDEAISGREITAWILVLALLVALVCISLKARHLSLMMKKNMNLMEVEMKVVRSPSHQVDIINDREVQMLLSQTQDHAPTQPSSTVPAKCSTCACQTALRLGGSQPHSCPNISVHEGRPIPHPEDGSSTKGQMVL
ncbi:uncharacterized protein LOC135472670 [Liolophura sinensis]|uniref:uncharacterized protein LOC135472670 n=1 Tax=Liolophura sinensis TaxID=3198878 RepID=UPI003157F720